MKIADHIDFNPHYPENFNWSMANSVKCCKIAEDIARKIKKELKNESAHNRVNVPGLRKALVVIASVEDCD